MMGLVACHESSPNINCLEMRGEKVGRFQQIFHKEGTSSPHQQNKGNIELAMT